MQDKKVMEFETFSPEETLELGRKFGREAQPGEVYTLVGDLGVGKTVFTQGIAQGLGIEEPICSPTFTIVQVYEEGRMPFYHFDVYRIGDIEEMDEIGYEDYFYGEDLPPRKIWHLSFHPEIPVHSTAGKNILFQFVQQPECLPRSSAVFSYAKIPCLFLAFSFRLRQAQIIRLVCSCILSLSLTV
jgi:tRNA threonylcarbamoyladenosine biosynthesis protein TsaE